MDIARIRRLRAISRLKYVAALALVLASMAAGVRADNRVSDQLRKYKKWSAYRDKLRTAPGLVAYYDFEASYQKIVFAGNDAYVFSRDSGGVLKNMARGMGGEGCDPRSLDGVTHNTSWVQGRWPIKKALNFDERSRSHVNCGDNPILDITKAITVQAWILPRRIDGYQPIVDRIGKTSRNGYYVSVYQYTPDRPGVIRFCASNNGDDRVTCWSDLAVTKDQWNHIAITYDNNEVHFYVNGVEDSKVHKHADGIGSAGEQNLRIGAFNQWENYFDGLIDELAIYNKVLTAEEIRSHYETGKP